MNPERSVALSEFLKQLSDDDGAFAGVTFDNLGEPGFGEDNALHAAVWRDNVPIAGELIELGVDIDSQGDMNQTALHIAVGKQNTEMIELLLDKGANLFSIDQLHGQPPFFNAMLRKNDELIFMLFDKLLGVIDSGSKPEIIESWIKFHERHRQRLQALLEANPNQDCE